jgi:DEAD/DEAH box helicase domain-containing protein
MIPSVLARQLRRGVADFLKTSFTTTTPYFEGLWERFLENPDHVFRGPFYHFALPFETADRPWAFERLDLASLIPKPWQHQLQAWERLSGTGAKSTVIATGTGSGKTECFLYPIIDHCAANRGPGIKAIFLYPMNALATDQARRIASTIASQAGLRGLRAGLFV